MQRRNALQLLMRNCIPKPPKFVHTVAFVVGHHKSKPGARGLGKIGCNEFFFNKEVVAPLFQEEAPKYGINLKVFYRMPVTERTPAWHAMQSQDRGFGKTPDLVLEGHFNCTRKSKDSRRYTCTIATGKKGKYRDTAFKAGVAIQREICKALDRPAFNYSDNYVWYKGYAWQFEAPWILLEPAFGNNEDDAALLHDRSIHYVRATLSAVSSFLKA